MGVLQTFLGHWLNIHQDLEHMQYGNNYWTYGAEAAFYSGGWAFLLYFFVDNRREAEGRSRWYAYCADPTLNMEKEQKSDGGPRANDIRNLGI